MKSKFSMLSTTFHVHAALKLAPILPQKSQEMQVGGQQQKQARLPSFFFIILIITILPLKAIL